MRTRAWPVSALDPGLPEHQLVQAWGEWTGPKMAPGAAARRTIAYRKLQAGLDKASMSVSAQKA